MLQHALNTCRRGKEDKQARHRVTAPMAAMSAKNGFHQSSVSPVASVWCNDGPCMLPFHRLRLCQPQFQLLLQLTGCKHQAGPVVEAQWRFKAQQTVAIGHPYPDWSTSCQHVLPLGRAAWPASNGNVTQKAAIWREFGGNCQGATGCL